MANEHRAEKSSAGEANAHYEPPRVMRKRTVAEVTLAANCSHGKKVGNPFCSNGKD